MADAGRGEARVQLLASWSGSSRDVALVLTHPSDTVVHAALSDLNKLTGLSS